MSLKLQKLITLALISFCILSSVLGKKADPENKPKWAKKDIRDFDDADLERLYDQWEVRYIWEIKSHHCQKSKVSF
jgi:hypothetical protein